MSHPFYLPVKLARLLILPLCVATGFVSAAQAQVVIAPPPTVGSAAPVSPEPTVLRPNTTPCKVALFANAAFTSAASQSFTYTPPSACPGPWAKVVFTADFTVAAGVQTEQNVGIYLDNATLFRGTTAIPSASLSPSWHVEGDVTDLSALFGSAQTVIAASSIVVNSTNTSALYANAELDFYPASPSAIAATVPDQVVPIVAAAATPVQTSTTANPLSVSVTLPKNTTQLYLDLVAQPDELWWLSTPNAQVAPYIHKVDATAFRELDVSIDGKPAGVAPNHPYIFAGGVDPYLWRPIVGAQTLHLAPYRINLTPFAGALSDGAAHTITITDANTIGSTYLNADLLVYVDHGGATVTGAVSSNTLTVNPGTTVTSNVNLDANGNGTASVSESLQRSFAITGYVITSAGKFTTTVAETVNFENNQQLTNQSSPVQNVVTDTLTSTVDSTVTTVSPTALTTATYHTENPLQTFITLDQLSAGGYAQTTTANLSDVNNQNGPGTFSSNASESVMATDSLALDANKNITSNSGASSTGTYQATDSLGNKYSSTLTSANNVLTGATTNSSSSGSTLFVTASATTIAQGTSVTLTATAIPTNSTLTPTGRITFYANNRELSILPLGGGTVSVNVNYLAVGTNTITATYDGDANFIPEASMNVVTVTVTPVAGSFTIGPISPATISVSPGQSAIVSVPVTSGTSFSGTVTLSCTGAPADSTCVVNPSSVALVPSTGNVVSTQTVSVVVTTTATSVAENRPPTFGGSTAGALGGVSIAGIFLLMLPKRRSKGWKNMTLMVLLFCGLGLCSVVTLTGCGSGGTKAPTLTGTPAGTSTITVTGTSGSITQTATFTLTVN